MKDSHQKQDQKSKNHRDGTPSLCNNGISQLQRSGDSCCGSSAPVQAAAVPGSLAASNNAEHQDGCCSSEFLKAKDSCCSTSEGAQAEGGCSSTTQPGQSEDSCCPSEPIQPAKTCSTAESTHFGDDCCSSKEQELAALAQDAGIKRVLQIVLLINLAMFVSEFTAGVIANSTALMADSIDMLGDASVYIVSLYALSRGPRWKAGAALMKGGIILVFGLWIGVEVVLKMLYGVTPTAGIMGIFGAIALAANVSCLLLLWRYRKVDVNMSSTYECSRNDIIANVGVLLAAAGVWWAAAAWPDILVGSIVAALFFRSSIRVIGQAWPQFRSEKLSAH
jgi:Co/Zn/Cd efflux system component